MIGSKELFVFPKAAPYLPEIDEWLSSEPAEYYSIARHWFAVFRQCGDDVSELLHDGCPTACVGGAAFGYVNVFRHHVNIGFFTGALIDDPKSMLEGTGKRMRHIKIRPEDDIDSLAVHRLIQCAYEDVKNRLGS